MMTRKEFLMQGAALGAAILIGGPLAGCKGDTPNLESLVISQETGQPGLVGKEGERILLGYEIIPKNRAERRKSKFANYSFSRGGGKNLYSPVLKDERWLQHYKILRGLFGQPLDSFAVEDIDPMFGMFANRVHPTTLKPRYHHTGIDIFKPKGSEIKAAHGGIARLQKDNLAGKWVAIRHPIKTKDGYELETRYLHLDSFDPKLTSGSKVTKGQSLGKLGGTGVMDGYFPHLHMEVVMINPSRPDFPIVLDPARVYFDPKRSQGLADKFSRMLGNDKEQAYFRSLTGHLRGPGITQSLAKTIKGMSEHDKRFLPLYKEFWRYASRGGDKDARELLKYLKE